MGFLLWVLVLSLLVTGANCERETPEQALAAYVEYWQTGEYESMYNLLSVQAQSACSMDVFAARHRNISEGIALARLSLAETHYQGGRMDYKLVFDTATVGEFSQDYSLMMVEEEGGWRLNWEHCHIFPGLTSTRVVRVKRELPERGDILDANLLPLATNGTVYEVGVVPGGLGTETVAALALLVDKASGEIGALLHQGWVKEDSFVPVITLAGDVWAELRPALTALSGVLVRAVSGRLYGAPPSLAQTVGYIGEVSGERLEDLAGRGFEAGDLVGCCGLELLWDEALAGQPGFTIDIRDSNENVLSVVARRPVVDGRNMISTLDLQKCSRLDAALGEWPGCMLLLDFVEGDILGLASKPGFDSNLFVRAGSLQYEELLALDSPFLNRAFNGLYPPGSVFKPFTALMALEQGVCDPTASWDTPQHWQGSPDWGGYRVTRVLRPLGSVDLWAAMRWSDNVYFADLGLKVGWPAFVAYGQQLGFGQDLPFPLSYEQSQLGGEEGSVLLADSSYGQGRVLVTPLHMALMYAAIARKDGILPCPRLEAGTASSQWLSAGFASHNLELMDNVLAYTASDSTALAWVGSSTVRGKTGTSEISEDRQVAWYICYFDNMLLAVTLEGDSTLSSTDAVQVARKCLSLGIRQ